MSPNSIRSGNCSKDVSQHPKDGARSKESPNDDRDEMPVTELIISNGSKGQ